MAEETLNKDIKRIAEYRVLIKNFYKENCISSCLDGIEGIDYELTDDFGIINLIADNENKYTLADVNKRDKIVFLNNAFPIYLTNVRGRKIQLLDDEEYNKTVLKRFMQEAVIPELNAYRFAYIAGNMCKKNDMTYEKLLEESEEKDIITFVSKGLNKLNERVVPKTQFYNSIDLLDGLSDERGGFIKHKALYDCDIDGREIKFITVNKKSLFTFFDFELKIDEKMLSFIVYHDIFVRKKYHNLVCSEVF